MANGNTNTLNRRPNSRRRNNQQRGSPTGPAYSVIQHEHDVVTLNGGATKTIDLANNAKPDALAVRTHVRYHVMSHQFVNIRPRPSPALSYTRVAYQSGWIKVEDWDDVVITALVKGDIHIDFESRGFVQR